MPITLNGPSSPESASNAAWGALEAGGQALAGAFTAAGQMFQHWDQVNSQAKIDELSWKAEDVKKKTIQELKMSEIPPNNWSDIVTKRVSDFVRGNLGDVPIGRMADGFYNSVMAKQVDDSDRMYAMESEAFLRYNTEQGKRYANDDTIKEDEAEAGIFSLFYSKDGNPTHSSLMAYGPGREARNTAMATMQAAAIANRDMKSVKAQSVAVATNIPNGAIDEKTGLPIKPLSFATAQYAKKNKEDIGVLTSRLDVINIALRYARTGELPKGVTVPQELLGSTEEQLMAMADSIKGQITGKSAAMEQSLQESSIETRTSISAMAQDLAKDALFSGKGQTEMSRLRDFVDKWLDNINKDNDQVSGLTDKDKKELIPELDGILKNLGSPDKKDNIETYFQEYLNTYRDYKPGKLEQILGKMRREKYTESEIKNFQEKALARQNDLSPPEQWKVDKLKEIEAIASKIENKEDAQKYKDEATNIIGVFTEATMNNLKVGDGINSAEAFRRSQERPMANIEKFIRDPAKLKQYIENKKSKKFIDYDETSTGVTVTNFMLSGRAQIATLLSGSTPGKMRLPENVRGVIGDQKRLEVVGQLNSLLTSSGVEIPIRGVVVTGQDGKQSRYRLIPMTGHVREGSAIGKQSSKSVDNVRAQPLVAIVDESDTVIGVKLLSENATNIKDVTGPELVLSTGTDTHLISSSLGRSISDPATKNQTMSATRAFALDPIDTAYGVPADNYNDLGQIQEQLEINGLLKRKNPVVK